MTSRVTWPHRVPESFLSCLVVLDTGWPITYQKTARAACCSLLTTLIEKILADPKVSESWADLLAFGPAILGKPPRGGRRSNFANLIKKRMNVFEGHQSIPQFTRGRFSPRSHSEILSAAVSSKIEQGTWRQRLDLSAPTRLLHPRMLSPLTSLRPSTPMPMLQGDPSPARCGTVLQYLSQLWSKLSSHSPNGSSGGLDCLRPQHLKDLVCGLTLLVRWSTPLLISWTFCWREPAQPTFTLFFSAGTWSL